MIKLYKYIADRVIEHLESHKKSLVELDFSTYSIHREIQTIHDLNFTKEEKDLLSTLQKNLMFKRIIEKCVFGLSIASVNATSQVETAQARAGVRALEFFKGEIEKNKPQAQTNPLTGLPIDN